jgi:AcrR family transcriptional regulator
VFLAEGFAGATTDAIAKAAGVSKQTLYVYYSDKEQLMVDVLASLITELNRDQPVLQGSRPVDSVAELRTALLDIASGMLQALSGEDYLALTRVIIADSPRVPQIGQLWAKTMTSAIRSVVADQLEQARRARVIDVDDVEVPTRLFVGGVLSYVLPDAIVAHDGPVTLPAPDVIERLVNTFLRVVT